MINKTEEQFLCIIKDFNIPAVNGTQYNLDASCSQQAIHKFINKKEVFGELCHPERDQEDHEQFMKRLQVVDIDKAVIHISELAYDSDKKQIVGLVKKIGNKFPDLFEKLKNNEVAFGMRSLCFAYKKSDDGPVIHDIEDIITFDIINAVSPDNI